MERFGFIAEFEEFLALHSKAYIKRPSPLCPAANEYLFEQYKLIIRLVPICCHSCQEQSFHSISQQNCHSTQQQNCPITLQHRESCHYPQRYAEFSSSGSFAEYDVLYLYEDRWRSGGEQLRARILSRLGTFRSLFARKCQILTQEEFGRLFRSHSLPDTLLAQIAQLGEYDQFMRRSYLVEPVQPSAKVDATIRNLFNHLTADFLQRYHSYGAAKCKYRVALLHQGEMVAVATFSDALRMTFGVKNREEAIPSYEWVRYASLPDLRIAGGMGRLLGEFCRIVQRQGVKQFEVMTYSDNEWSKGAVYEQLGFRQAAQRAPVEYYVHIATWQRYSKRQYQRLLSAPSSQLPLPAQMPAPAQSLQERSGASCKQAQFVKIANLGSKKFILTF